LPSCGGSRVADGQPDGPIAEISYEVQSASEGLNIAGDDLKGGDLAVLDLGYPGDADSRGGGDLLPVQGQLLAGLGELCPQAWASSWRVPASDRVVYPFQKWAVNPIVPLEDDLGIPSPGYVLLETTGRTGLPPRGRRASARHRVESRSRPTGLAWPAGVWVAGR
jgi:hypothetical protein